VSRCSRSCNSRKRRALQQFAPGSHRTAVGPRRDRRLQRAGGTTIAARLQEFFGLRRLARSAGGRCQSCADCSRQTQPVQVTTDLPSFWQNVYPDVRRELSRRYPAIHGPRSARRNPRPSAAAAPR